MGAIGNKFWEARSSHGRKPLFASPEMLWEACVEYFNWMHENPLHEAKAFAFQGDITVEALPKLRAMTISGMCLFLDIDVTTWGDYRRKDDFSHICSTAEQIIYNQKFQGAAADLLNASIIARDLGLKDQTSTESTVSVDMKAKMAIFATEITPQQAEDAYKSMLG